MTSQALTPEQQEIAVQTLTRLGRVRCLKTQSGAQAIAAALALTPAQAEDVLANLVQET